MPRPRRRRPPPKPRKSKVWLRAGGLLIFLSAVAALVLAADWWICLPEGAMESARYVGRQVCVECHPKEAGLWTGSDHDLAMDHATPETVLGDFDEAEFTHFAFDDLLELERDELEALLDGVEPWQWAAALQDPCRQFDRRVTEALKKRILGGMPDDARAQLEQALAERERMTPLRPCDVADAHHEIGDVMRRLKREGKIEGRFAVTSKLFRRGEEFFVTTDNRQGELETFPVKYVLGVRPLQQYLVEFPDGRVQCLPVTWDTEGKRWYHLYPKEPIPHNDVLHWTGRLQNWNYMCAECHTTNLLRGYHLADDAYHTTFSEIDVSCETCHGPGSVHVELAEGWGVFWDRRHGYGLPRLKDENPRVEIETCAPCHARRRVIYPGSRPGGKLLDHYVPQILDNNLYYADGQILDEDYVYGSFVQSLMYEKGVRCTNCHDPHTARLKTEDPATPRPIVP
ncbi:MAG: FliG C-terminal domain-containing protein, partial [Planctomycetota bacterium]